MSSTEAVVLSLFYGLSIVFGCIANLLIIIAVIKQAELRRRRANHFLASLCFSDFLTCLFSMSYHLVHLHKDIFSHFLSLSYCRVTQYFIYVLAFSSTLCLTMVCIDRYLAIIHPFVYIRESMSRVSYVLLAWPWLMSLTTSVPALVIDMIKVRTDFGFPCGAEANWHTVRYFLAVIPVNILIPFICIVVTCLVVFRVARKQLRNIQTQIFVLKGPGINCSDSDERTSNNEHIPKPGSSTENTFSLPAFSRRKKRHKTNHKKLALKHRLRLVFREETRIAFATLAVVIGFFIAWTPYLVSRMLFAIGQSLPNHVYMFGTVFVLSNSAWNPFLILLFRKDVRKAVKNLLKEAIWKRLSQKINGTPNMRQVRGRDEVL